MCSLKFRRRMTGLFLFWGTLVFSQTNNDFKIFYSEDKYTVETQKLLLKQDNFLRYRLLTNAHIDPKKTGGVDKDVFVKSVQRNFPEESSKGIICIDIENKIYQDLLKYNIRTPEFEKAQEEFVWMIKKIKLLRPNVKVGIYGIPFREYYDNPKSCDSKLDKILSLSDYIFPSLYTMYLNNQVGKTRNEKYLADNLKCALDFGIRLNKPVVPFVWDIVHPSNRKYGGQLVSTAEMKENLAFIQNFKYKNKRVYGVIWWDPDHKSFSKMNKTKTYAKTKVEEKEPKQEQSELLKEYLQEFIKNK